MTASVHELRPRPATPEESARRAAAMRAHPSAAHKAHGGLRIVHAQDAANIDTAAVLPLRPGGR